MLFATLDTSIRNIKFDSGKAILLSDTVGFINKLPHHLVKAFHSTLEEVREADLLLHVVDGANSNYQKQIEVTNATLKYIGADHIPQVYVYNKVDLVLNDLLLEGELSVNISAKKGTGLPQLIDVLTTQLFADYRKCQLLIPYDEGQIISYLKEHATILNLYYIDEGTMLEVELSEADFKKFEMYVQAAD